MELGSVSRLWSVKNQFAFLVQQDLMFISQGTGTAVVHTASSTVVSQNSQHRQATAAASVIVTTTPSVVQTMPSVLQVKLVAS